MELMEIMGRSSYAAEGGLHKNKKRRSAKSHASSEDPTAAFKKSTRKDLTASNAGSVFNEFLVLNSSPSGTDDSQKPRSHANARERDRTHRCVMLPFTPVFPLYNFIIICPVVFLVC